MEMGNPLSYSQVLETRNSKYSNSLISVDEAEEMKLDEDWTCGDHVEDVYRFVQPRRLSSWVQDDAVSSCYHCRMKFSLLFRKHHCRACGRIFCNNCSCQRVVIPLDYESTPLFQDNHYPKSVSSSLNLISSFSWIWSNDEPANDTSIQLISSKMMIRMMGSWKDRDEEYLVHHAEILRETYPRLFFGFQRASKRSMEMKTSSSSSSSSSNSSQPLTEKSSASSLSSSSVEASSPIYVPDGSLCQRVCDDCASILHQRRQHQDTAQVLELCGFDLCMLRTIGMVCRKWHRASIMCLSMFRQIQYYLPTHQLTLREKKLLWVNRKYLAGHSKWLVKLIRVVNWKDTSVTNEMFDLLAQSRRCGCMMTMCSRLCRESFGADDALEILDGKCMHQQLREIGVYALKRATSTEWLSYLPILLYSLQHENDPSGSFLGKTIIEHALTDVFFRSDLYWSLTVLSEDRRCRRKFDCYKQRFILQLVQHLGDATADQLFRGQQFVDLLYRIPPRLESQQAQLFMKELLFTSPIFRSSSEPLRLPVDPSIQIIGIDTDLLEVKTSAEAPLLVTCIGVNKDNTFTIAEAAGTSSPAEAAGASSPPAAGTSSPSATPPSATPSATPPPPPPPPGTSAGPSLFIVDAKLERCTYQVLFKRDDLRKDAIVQNIISLMYSILKKETQLDIPLVTYRVVPTSSYDGMIQVIQNAETLYRIIKNHGSIMSYLHKYNGHRTINELSTSFRESLAAYTVITFLLGVGDRHADNVMLTRSGILFHIDYGFILGKDPKPLQPPMRLDSHMIDALGGADAITFEAFKESCVIAFNCLRRHVSLFMRMLMLVVKSMPEITDFNMGYSEDDLQAFVLDRFLPGQTDEEAAIALKLRMEGKFNERIGLHLSDFVHAHIHEKTVARSVSTLSGNIRVGVETVGTTVHTVAQSITTRATTWYNFVCGKS